MKLSVVMATRNKAPYLRRTLESIVSQRPAFAYEVIVVDDGSSDDTPFVCDDFPVRSHRLDRVSDGNNAVPFNIGYRMAKGDIILTTSDEVEHRTPELMARLVERLTPTTYVSPRVFNVDAGGNYLENYCGRNTPAQLLCAAIWRNDIYAIGGHDEEFTGPGGNDRFLTRCLQHLPRKFVVCGDLVTWHYDHPKPLRNDRRLYFQKLHGAQTGRHPWTARAGAWG